MKSRAQKLGFLMGVVIATLLIGASSLYAGTPAPNQTVKLSLGKADTVDLPGNVADILVADPGVADVGALRSDRLYVVGRSVGNTNVLAFDDAGELLAHIDVHVRVDEKTLRDTLKEFFPKENIQARTVNEDIVLTGQVSSPAVANQVRDMAGRFTGEGQTVMDLMSVRGEQQVVLRVKIMEANRSALREIGVDTDFTLDRGMLSDGASLAGIGGGVGAASILGLTQTPFAQGSITNVAQGIFDDLDIAVQALERRGLVSTLASPNLTAISGESAGFLAGGEFPVPTGIDNNGNIVIEFKPFGVSLTFRPTVLSGERISLQLRTEVSSLVESDGIELQNVQIPGISVRRAETTVEMGSGGGLMIAGLIKSEMTRAMNSVPGIADIPILGELFKSRSFDQEESELLIMVNVLLVKPYAERTARLLDEQESGLTQLAKAVPAALPVQPDPSEEDAPIQPDPLAAVFSDNLRQVYGSKRVPKDLETSSGYGYILD